MAILNAIIENKGNTLIIDFPHSIYDVYEKLLSVGIRKSPNDIMLTDNEDDDIQSYILTATSEIMLFGFSERITVLQMPTQLHICL